MTRPIIVGVGMSKFGRQPESTLKSLAGCAAAAALADAGMEREEIECVFAANVGAGLITGQEGIRGQVALKETGLGGMPLFNVENACASGSSAVHLASKYLASGAAETALVIGYEKMSAPDKSLAFKAIDACGDVEEIAAIKNALGPDGAGRSVFMDFYAQKVRKYLAESGATKRHLAAVAAKNHCNGIDNEHAHFRSAQTVESVLESREVVDPLHLLMCSPVSDGGAAVVLATENWAKAHCRAGPAIAASKLSSDSFSNAESQVRKLAFEAYREAGLGVDDIDLAEVHDGSAPGEIFAYEELGFAEPGRGWTLIDEGIVFRGGRRPVNVGGGLIARGHPLGATGVAQICELAWQLRGDAGPRQVRGARAAVAHCLGGQVAFGKTTGAAAMSIVVLAA
jgi:acetyl-CoA acetyltransferase